MGETPHSTTGPRLGLIGKHPGFGDFLRVNLDEPLAAQLDAWLTHILPQIKEDAGPHWAGVWDNAPVLRFWAGNAILPAGQGTIAGIMIPARDKVGRRFPLIVCVQGARIEPPHDAPDQEIYEALEAHILPAMFEPVSGAAESLLSEGDAQNADGKLGALLQTLAPIDDTDLAQNPLIWAHNSDGDLAGLLAAAAPVDPQRAQSARSYWWSPAREGAHPALWLGTNGWPTHQSLGWLLAGGPQTPAIDETEAPSGDPTVHGALAQPSAQEAQDAQN